VAAQNIPKCIPENFKGFSSKWGIYFDFFIKLLKWMKTRKGLTFLCYKNELGHKQLLLIVFGIRNYRLGSVKEIFFSLPVVDPNILKI
jgi:hypothetical protein